MFKNIMIMAGLMIAVAALSGCAEVNQAAYGAGQAGGTVMTVPRSVTQGGADAYVDSNSSNSNPYLR